MMGSIKAGKGMDCDMGMGGSNGVVLVECDEHKGSGQVSMVCMESERVSKEGCLHGFCRFGESHMDGT